MGKLLRRIHYFFRRRRIEAELAEEMNFHRAMLERELHGGPAARAWGNTGQALENSRAVWLLPWIESFWQDLAYGVRGMRRAKGFTAVALAALSIAIGLNTSLFTVFNAIALRPWPVKDPTRVVNVVRLMRKGPEDGHLNGFGVTEWRYFAERTRAFTGLILTRNGERVEVQGRALSLTWVTANYFSVLGVDMARGRGFLPDEDRALAPEAVAVLNYATWQGTFGGDPAIVGKTVRLDEVPFTIVGVAPEPFAGTDPNRADFWAPLAGRRLLRPHDTDVLSFLTNVDHCCSSMAGRLAPGYSRAQGAAEIDQLAGQLHGQSEEDKGRVVMTVGTAMLQTADRNRKVVPVIAAMFVAMTLVLLLACANVGNLLLARAAARQTEIGIRLSLGSSRARLIRQLVMEGLTLAAAAAVLGLAIAWIAPAAVVARMIPDNALAMRPDLQVCAYTVGLALIACLVFGLAPALHATRGRLSGALKRDLAAGAARHRLRGVLLAAQVAISVVLLSSAGLLIRGLERAQHQDPGFQIDRVTTATLELPAAVYSGTRAQSFTAALEDSLAQAADLPATAMSNDLPMANSRSFTTLRRAGDPPDSQRLVQVHQVTPGYFDVLRIPLLAGRNFTRADARRQVALLNQTAARLLWGAENPVGRMIESNEKKWEIVGVLRDAYTTDLQTIQPTLYWPLTGSFGVPKLLVRDGYPAARQRIAAMVAQLEPKGRIVFTPLEENLRMSLAPARYAAILAGALGLLALGLATIGMAGVFAYAVRQRTREIGIRMALGARPAEVVRLVLTTSLRAVSLGLAAGLAGAFAATRLLQGMMGGVRWFDLPAYGGVLLLLTAAAAAASAFPARRAVRVDPVVALRWD